MVPRRPAPGRQGDPVRPPRTAAVIAVCLYAVLIPLQPVLTLPDGSALRFAASEAVAPFVFLAALARPRRRLPAGLAALALAIPLLALFVTLIAAADRSLSGYAIGKTVGLFYLVGFACAVVRATEPGAEAAVLHALAWGALWSAVVGLAGFAASLAGFETTLVQGPRVCSTMPGDPNIFCSVLALGLLITAMDRQLSIASRSVRSAILVIAILATGSRSGAVAALVAIVVCTFLRDRDVWLTTARTALIVLVVGVISTLLLLTESGAAAAQTLWDHIWRTFTVESRFDLYEAAFREFTEHPVGGLGIGGFNDLNTFNHGGRAEHFAVHNTYLWALVDMGLGGCLLLVGLIAAGIWRSGRAALARRTPDSASVTAAGLLAMAAFNLFIDGFYQRHFWVLMACALGVPAARTVRRSSACDWRGRRERSLAYSGAR
jgi:O-antigen ligase